MARLLSRPAGEICGPAFSLRGRVLARQQPLPGKRVRNDRIEIVALRRPAEFAAREVGIGDDGRGVARPAARSSDDEVGAGDAAHAVDDLEHRIAVAIAAIGDQAVAAGAQTWRAPGGARRRGR